MTARRASKAQHCHLKTKSGKPRPMPLQEVMTGPILSLPAVPSLAQQRNSTNLDFALALSSASTPMTMVTRAVAPASTGRKYKAKNPFSLSDEA